jgi:hypothetical protein
MTDERSIERLLDHWLDEGPSTAPDRVLDAAVDRIGRQRQRPAWRLHSGREFHVISTSKLAATVAAVLVIAVLGVVLVLRPGGSTVGSSGPTAAPSPSSLPSGYPIGGLLPPGSHTTKQFKPAVTFTVPEGWIKTADDAQTSAQLGVLGLMQDTPANRAEFARTGEAAPGILLVSGLTSPYYVCQSWEDNSGATAAEMVAKVTTNPRLKTSGVDDVAIGGLTGKQFDVRFNLDFKNETCPGDPPGTSLSDQPTRSILLDAPGGRVLVMFVGAPGGANFEALLAQAMPVIDSFKFERGQ